MPLLPLEPFLFPDDLLTGALSHAPAGSPERWWVLHTRPRAEKSLARCLLGRGSPFFLPLYQREWRSHGRARCSNLPLFSGYVFLFGDGQARLDALDTNHVAGVLPVADQARLYSDLAGVYRLMQAGAPLTPEERLEPGAIVEIASGLLAGLEGKVLRRGKKMKLVVEVQLLQRGVSVEIERWMIRALPGARAVLV